MPHFICDKKDVEASNAFYRKTGSTGQIPVICFVAKTKANIEIDANALDTDLRSTLLDDASDLAAVIMEVYQSFGSPKVKTYGAGFYSDFRDMDADTAVRMAPVLAQKIDELTARS